MSSMEETPSPPKRRLLCATYFDALWFLHSLPLSFQLGSLDNCSGKWTSLVDCLALKTKRSSEVQEILETREKGKSHKEQYGDLDEVE
ncbi:hypothetical protein D8674_021495 [Pyrus ussuriensis x Pyrus communis]|uniref:Uncharacterized protein n=1 Tax=Pyrus ussuriensis x Pyrus communis TaxID=2448454 RepID=A0A5N5GIF5_9ROSA|nr:hypothetical protein D8674_021495 [Pyrus ussuriensis x Pyrus communis]